MKKLTHVISLIGIISTISAFGALEWTPEEGWQAKGGLLEPIVGKAVNVKDAQDCMAQAKQFEDECDDSTALSLYNKVYCSWPQSRSAPEALYRSGKIYMESHQFETAFGQFQRIIMDYPGYEYFDEVIEIQFELASRLQCGQRPYYWGIIPGFKDYTLAISYFESIVANAPFSKYAPMALMNISDLAREHKRPEDVIDALERLTNNYRDSDLAPQAYIHLAEAHAARVHGPDYDQGATKKAINYYTDFLFLFPDHELACCAEEGLNRAQELLAQSNKKKGDFYFNYRNNPCAAKIYYNQTITAAPNSHAAEEAKYMLCKIDNCEEPPRTPADWVFGRYERPSIPTYLDEMAMSKRDTEKFETYREVHVDEAIEDFEQEHIIDETNEPLLKVDNDMENLRRIEEKWVLDRPGPYCAPQEYECQPDGTRAFSDDV